MQRKDSGFTLIELIVVIGIITVLAAILFPVISSARQKANQSSCLNNVRQIAIAIQIYTNDNNNIFPSMTTIWQGLNLSNKTYICPAIGKKLQNGYGYNYSLNNQLLSDADNITNPSQIVEVADCRKNSLYPNIISTPGDIDYRHNGFASFGFVDGHVCSLNSCPNLPLFSYVDLAASWLPIPIGSQYSPGWAYNAVDDGALQKIYPGWTTNQSGQMSLWAWDGIGKENDVKPAPCINMACTNYTANGTPGTNPIDLWTSCSLPGDPQYPYSSYRLLSGQHYHSWQLNLFMMLFNIVNLAGNDDPTQFNCDPYICIQDEKGNNLAKLEWKVTGASTSENVNGSLILNGNVISTYSNGVRAFDLMSPLQESFIFPGMSQWGYAGGAFNLQITGYDNGNIYCFITRPGYQILNCSANVPSSADATRPAKLTFSCGCGNLPDGGGNFLIFQTNLGLVPWGYQMSQ